MNILMLSWEYPPRIVGGISRVVHDLAQKLGEQGNEVHVVTCWEPGTKDVEIDKNVTVHRVHTYDVHAYSFIDWVLQLNISLIEHSIKLVNDIGKFDIIHAHDWIVAFAARALKNAYSIPIVSTIHATEYGRNWGIHNDNQRYINNVEWWLTYESWETIVNSYYMKNEVQSVFQLPENKINVIPNGVDVNKFKGYERNLEFRRDFALDHEKIVFFVGRLVNEKGVQILIDAMPKIISNYNDVKFIIAGKGPQMDFLRNKVSTMRVGGKVYFTGYIDDDSLSKFYKCADVAVFPSLYEPFGIVALEGIVADVPIVVSDTGGLAELVDHGVDGMKSYAGNANSLADSILEILYHPDRAEEMKKRALEKVDEVYNWDKIGKQTMEVYKRVVYEVNEKGWKASEIKDCFNENIEY